MVRVLFILFCPFAAFLRLSEQTSRHHYLSPWKFYIPHYHMLYQHILIWKCSGLYLGAVTSHYTLQWSEHTVSYTSISISRDGNLQGPCRFTYLHTCPLFSRLQQVPMHAQRPETVFAPSLVTHCVIPGENRVDECDAYLTMGHQIPPWMKITPRRLPRTPLRTLRRLNNVDRAYRVSFDVFVDFPTGATPPPNKAFF